MKPDVVVPPARPVRVGVVSDTHLNHLTGGFRDACLSRFDGIEQILHAGDVVAEQVLSELGVAGWTVTAVRGNMDYDPGLQDLPWIRLLTLGGVRIGLCHGGGSLGGVRSRILDAFGGEKVDVIVYGHTHRPDDTTRYGVRFINPGSATGPRGSNPPTAGILTVSGGHVDFELVRMDG